MITRKTVRPLGPKRRAMVWAAHLPWPDDFTYSTAAMATTRKIAAMAYLAGYRSAARARRHRQENAPVLKYPKGRTLGIEG